jgi:hypothetical protein
MTMTAPNQKNASNNYSDLMLLVYDYNNHTQKFYDCIQGQIHDSKLGGGGALKKIAPSGRRCENFWGISCEKSRFYAKKSKFFPILRGASPPPPRIHPLYYRSNHQQKTMNLSEVSDINYLVNLITGGNQTHKSQLNNSF